MIFIKTDNELKELLSVSASAKLQKVKPYIENAKAERELIDVIGKELALHLEQKNDAGDGSDLEKEAIVLVKKALANLGYFYYLPFANVSFSDAGVTTNRENAAFQWQYHKLEEALVSDAFEALDNLYVLVSENIASFNKFSPEENKDLWIGSAKEFQQYVDISKSRRTYKALLPAMKFVQEQLSKEYDSAIEENLKVLKPALAHLTISTALRDMHIKVSVNGAYISTIASGSQNIWGKKDVEEAMLSKKIASHRNIANSYLSDLNNQEEEIEESLDYDQDSERRIFNGM